MTAFVRDPGRLDRRHVRLTVGGVGPRSTITRARLAALMVDETSARRFVRQGPIVRA